MVDLRTEKEKAYDAEVQATIDEFNSLMEQPRATQRRVIMYIAKKKNRTPLAIRNRLIKAGAIVPQKRSNGNGRA